MKNNSGYTSGGSQLAEANGVLTTVFTYSNNFKTLHEKQHFDPWACFILRAGGWGHIYSTKKKLPGTLNIFLNKMHDNKP